MSNAWSWYIIALVAVNIIGILWLLIATSRSNDIDDNDTTGHSWDGIEELNKPLPRWWFGLFILTIIFSCIYLYLYPGLGNYKGSLGWTQADEFAQNKQLNREKQAAFFAEFSGQTIPKLAGNKKAMATAERLYANNCAACHGADARGAKGFPNLTDNDWLYGGSPEILTASISNGRAGVMPNLGLSSDKIAVLARYVKHLSGEKVTEHVITKGEKEFAVCASCHGLDGKGSPALGAPNLTDSVWLHGSGIRDIEAVLANGKQGNMPSFKSLLSDDEIKLLAAYVYSFNQKD